MTEKKLKKEIKKRLDIEVDSIEYILGKDLWIATDKFTYILASKTLSTQELIKDFEYYRDMVLVSWMFARLNITPKRSDFPEIYEDLTSTIKELKNVKIMPDIDFIASFDNKDFINIIAFTDTSEFLAGTI